jgi:molybdopterin/thiamine biosynthesis adenylyltransferase
VHRDVSATGTETRLPRWYEALPERLEWELAQFVERGLPAERFDAVAGKLGIHTELSFGGEPVQIDVVFPYDYPEVEPTVYGPPALLPRHQNRRSGNFCLLANPALEWWPTMSAAQLIDEDLRWLLEDSEAGPAVVAAGEADMPEPLSQHIQVDGSKVVLVPDPFWALELGLTDGELVLHDAVLAAGQLMIELEGVGRAEAELIDAFSTKQGQRHTGRWVSVNGEAIPPYPSLHDVLAAALAVSPQVLAKLKRTLARERKRASVKGWIAVTFLEEGPQRGETRRAWLLLEVELDRTGATQPLRALRAQALTASERARRIPELAGLENARILVIGAGSLGGTIVFELAKAGVGRTDVLDYDSYDVNNAVRHVLEPRWAGTNKALAVSIEANYLNPFVQVHHHAAHVGGGPDHQLLLEGLIADADVVIDATGSQMAARILQRECAAKQTTLVLAALTAGSYGGEIAVFRSGGPCFWCLALGQQDGSVPEPPSGPASNLTPVGCSAPAFSGAGFDATALAAAAARTAIRVSGKSSYPPFEHDYTIVNFRGDGSARSGQLPIHPECPLRH